MATSSRARRCRATKKAGLETLPFPHEEAGLLVFLLVFALLRFAVLLLVFALLHFLLAFFLLGVALAFVLLLVFALLHFFLGFVFLVLREGDRRDGHRGEDA